MEYRKIINLIYITSDNVPIFITKKWIEVHYQSGNAEKVTNKVNKKDFKD